MRPAARGQSGAGAVIIKSIFLVALVGQVFGSVAPLPQRGNGNVHFPSNRQNIFPTPNPSANGIVPQVPAAMDHPPPPPPPHHSNNHGGNGNQNSVPSIPSNNEFQVGTTGISCDQPGMFVRAPDGCNRCFCAENRQLSSACSRVFCPPGFPSSSQGQYRL